MLVHSILYALGYPVPSTKGIKFEDMEFNTEVESNGSTLKIYRHALYFTIDDGQEQIGYSLPSDFYEVCRRLFAIDNNDVIDNLLGAFYMAQEKGWTLLNHGKVIGNIPFNIEALVRGLGGKSCEEQLRELEAVKRQIRKYEYMHNVAAYQQEISEAGEDLVFDSADEIIDRKIELLRAEGNPIKEELNQIKSILRKNKLLVEYISELKLIVQSNTGEEVPVTQSTLVGYTDNTDMLVARREILAGQMDQINRQIQLLKSQKKKEEGLVRVQNVIQSFDADISKIHVDAIATQQIIDQLKRQRKLLQEGIRKQTKSGNSIVEELHNYISSYATELGVSETYIAPNKDYIFTNDLKSLSGTILHKIVFSFKLAYIKLIKEKAGVVLPIIMDSSSGREVKKETVVELLKIVQRDFAEHRLIIASIHDFELENEKLIELKERLFDTSDTTSFNQENLN